MRQLNQLESALATNDHQHIAAVDLGSNSFHMIVARRGDDGTPTLTDRLREPVRLAEHLHDTGGIHPEAEQRALECLARFGQRLSGFPNHCVRAVGTNTMRRAQDGVQFRKKAEAALGHRIEIISGIEEARLIYAGVSLDRAPDKERRLVFDIGGGSTELIAGRSLTPTLLESLSMGCVVFSDQFFAKGKVNPKQWEKAVTAANMKLEPVSKAFRRHGWDRALGCSGTIRNVANIVACEFGETHITRKALKQIAEKLIDVGHVDKLKLDGLKDERRPVFAGGLAILYAILDSLDIATLELSDRALRDGLLMDLMGRLDDSDIRDASITAFAARFNADPAQAAAIGQTAKSFLRQAAEVWKLDTRQHGKLMQWAVQLLESGLAIAHEDYQRHSAYLVQHSDLAGFSRFEQEQLAGLIALHRGKPDTRLAQQLADTYGAHWLRLAVLLRLATVLHRDHQQEKLPSLKLSVDKSAIGLSFPKTWMLQHPLTQADLEKEQTRLASLGFVLTLS